MNDPPFKPWDPTQTVSMDPFARESWALPLTPAPTQRDVGAGFFWEPDRSTPSDMVRFLMARLCGPAWQWCGDDACGDWRDPGQPLVLVCDRKLNDGLGRSHPWASPDVCLWIQIDRDGENAATKTTVSPKCSKGLGEIWCIELGDIFHPDISNPLDALWPENRGDADLQPLLDALWYPVHADDLVDLVDRWLAAFRAGCLRNFPQKLALWPRPGLRGWAIHRYLNEQFQTQVSVGVENNAQGCLDPGQWHPVQGVSDVEWQLERPMCSPLTVIERWACRKRPDDPRKTRPSQPDQSEWMPPWRVGFIEAVSDPEARKWYYGELFFNPSAYYIARNIAERLGYPQSPVLSAVARDALNVFEGRDDAPTEAKGRLRNYYRWLTGFVTAVFADWVKKVNSGPKGKTVVFVSLQWNARLLNQARVLKAEGYACHLLVMHLENAPVRSSFEEVMDTVVVVPFACLAMLLLLMRRLRPTILHVFTNMFFNHLTWLIVANARKGVLRVVDCDDYLLIHGRPGFFDGLVPPDREKLDFQCCHLLLDRADRHLLQCGPQALRWIDDRHPGSAERCFSFLNWPCKAPTLLPRRIRSHNEPLRLVWAGNIWAPKEETRRFYASSGLLESMRALLDLGCEVDVLLDPHKQLDRRDPIWEPYWCLEKCGRFRFLPGVDSSRLPETLAEYDFGLLHMQWNPVFDFCYPQKFEYAVPNKCFAYWAAGIPILYSSSFVYSSWLVRYYDLGVIAGPQITQAIVEQMKHFSQQDFRHRIRKFCDENRMSGKLLLAYGSQA